MKTKDPRPNILKACEFTIRGMEDLRKELLNVDAKNKDLVWAIGGLISLMMAKLLDISGTVIKESMKMDDSSAGDDVREIQKQFNEFIDSMEITSNV